MAKVVETQRVLPFVGDGRKLRPSDPLSYLRMTGIGSGGTNGIAVAWGSATNKLYSLQRTSSLLLPFTDVAQHILSTPPKNSDVDATATNGAAFFYRVEVE